MMVSKLGASWSSAAGSQAGRFHSASLTCSKAEQRVAVAFGWASHSRLMAYGFVPCVQVTAPDNHNVCTRHNMLKCLQG
jgi:hypothetical protein